MSFIQSKTALALLVLTLAMIAGIWFALGSRVEMEWAGVALGDTKEEVSYKLGYPDSVHGPYKPTEGDWQIAEELPVSPSGEVGTNSSKPPVGPVLPEYHDWNYDNRGHTLSISFDRKTGRVRLIQCMKTEDQNSSPCPALYGLTTGDAEQRVRAKLGQPAREDLNRAFKSMEYPRKGATFMLTEGRIYALSLAAPGNTNGG